MPHIDTDPIKAQITSADDTNNKIRDNASRARLEVEVEEKVTEYKTLTAQLSAIADEKAAKMASVKFPIDGLSFGDDGVLFHGIPYEQASQAEQLKIAVMMGFARNPELKVMYIRNGSLLDDESLAEIAHMAEQYNGQIWVECVGDGPEVGIVLEDGCVAEDRTRSAADLAKDNPDIGVELAEPDEPAPVPVQAPATAPLRAEIDSIDSIESPW